jgi:hypothetical protein
MSDSAARSLYDAIHKEGQWSWAWAILTGRSHRLLSLAEVEKTCTVRECAYAGIRAVPIDHIRGSENRVNDFDRNFRPLQEHSKRRWLSVASARMQGKGLPPVDLIQIRDTYFCRDGHHRISVARALEQRDIDAQVTVWRVSEPPAPAPAARSLASRAARVERVHKKAKEVSTRLAKRLLASFHHLLIPVRTRLAGMPNYTRPIAQDASC